MSQIALQASATGTGTVSLIAPETNTSRTITLPDSNGVLSSLDLRAAIATTSGTVHDFLNIPTTARKITVMFSGVSTNGTSPIQVQIGAGAFQTSGYEGDAFYSVSGVVNQNHTTGFRVEPSDPAIGAATSRHGFMTLVFLGGATWVENSTLGASNNNGIHVSGGSVTLTGTLDRVRITTVNGTDTFDAGSVSILVE